jgi:hypothetical protein
MVSMVGRTVMRRWVTPAVFVVVLTLALPVAESSGVSALDAEQTLAPTRVPGVASAASEWVIEASVTGDDVAVSGDWAIVTKTDNGSPGTAKVYRYDAAEWVLFQELEPSAAVMDDLSFGASVSVEGGVAAVGAGGAVYVFEFDGIAWVEGAKAGCTGPPHGIAKNRLVSRRDGARLLGAESSMRGNASLGSRRDGG